MILKPAGDLMRIASRLRQFTANDRRSKPSWAIYRQTSPDQILHGGGPADSGSRRAGNPDQMLSDPESLETFAHPLPTLEPLWTVIRDVAAVTRDALGEKRLAWFGVLPKHRVVESLILLHAKPDDLWRADLPNVDDTQPENDYDSVGQASSFTGMCIGRLSDRLNAQDRRQSRGQLGHRPV